jgi:hypothetical protein
MSTGSVYKQAIKRVFDQKYHDKNMAVYWGRDDEAIHVLASLRHYVHEISDDDGDKLEFVSSTGDRVVVALNDDERRQLERAI